MRLISLAIPALLLAVLAPRHAFAEPVGGTDANRCPSPASERAKRPRVTWRWNARVGAGEGFITAFTWGAGGGAELIKPSPIPWTGRDDFDDKWRNLARLSSPDARKAADDWSSALLGAGLGGQAAADLIVSVALDRGGRGTCNAGLQVFVIDAQALGLTLLFHGVVSSGASRERPYGRLCTTVASLPDGGNCTGITRYESFFSGHTAFAFTLAGLTCMHHIHLNLYGGDAADVAACGVSLGTAAVVGVLRTMADKHYATDVLTGFAVGSLVGFGAPLLYYRSGLTRAASWTGASGVRATLVPGPLGGALIGTF
jgi:membrane-associated phospholipid phosphatase